MTHKLKKNNLGVVCSQQSHRDEAERYCIRLDWEGLAEVEFKRSVD